MEYYSTTDFVLNRIDSAIRLYLQPPNQGISARELIDSIFHTLATAERDDLIQEVARMIPESAKGDLQRVIEGILQPAATYTPFIIGRPSDEWRQRMIPACKNVAALFKLYFDKEQNHLG